MMSRRTASASPGKTARISSSVNGRPDGTRTTFCTHGWIRGSGATFGFLADCPCHRLLDAVFLTPGVEVGEADIQHLGDFRHTAVLVEQARNERFQRLAPLLLNLLHPTWLCHCAISPYCLNRT